MIRYLSRQVGYVLSLLFGASLLSFVLLDLTPGSFFDEIRLNPRISTETVNRLRESYGFTQPLPIRYWKWIISCFHGEFGYSCAYNAPVGPLMMARVANTLLLTGMAAAVTWLLAITFGVLAAQNEGGWLDHFFHLATSTFIALPDVVLALLFLLVAVRTKAFPVGGAFSLSSVNASVIARAGDLWSHLFLPLVVLVLTSFAAPFRHTRAAMLEVLNSRFIRSARALGVSPARLLFHHALPAAMNPLVSLLGVSVGFLLSSSLLTEIVFGWPGVGPFLTEAIFNRDFYIVVSSVTFSTLVLAVSMLATDFFLAAFDPRIRAGREA